MGTSQKGRIFISYRRDDTAGYAGRIFDRLSKHFGKKAVFMDVDTIEAGLDFIKVLQGAVQSCDVVIALIGRHWLNIEDASGKRRLDNPEDFVRIEIAAALDRDIRVIPVLVDGVTIPHSAELPDNLKPLVRRNALEINHHSFNADANRLISQLDLALKSAKTKRPEKNWLVRIVEWAKKLIASRLTLRTLKIVAMIIILFSTGVGANYLFQNWSFTPIARISPKDGMTMVYVKAGDFLMGSNNGDNDEKPVQPVYLDNFWIDQIEVTNAMYAECVLSKKCAPPRSSSAPGSDYYFGNPEFDNYPVIYVSWDDASSYCAWAERRLPSEAEWEKAATWDEEKQSKYIYPWGNTFAGARLNFCDKNCIFDWANKSIDDGFADVAPVGSYPSGSSPYGAYDMAGNVWEWVADWYSETYYSDSPSANPSGPDSGDFRVLRGGAWLNIENYVRSSDRNWSDPGLYNYDFGFRCAVGTK